MRNYLFDFGPKPVHARLQRIIIKIKISYQTDVIYNASASDLFDDLIATLVFSVSDDVSEDEQLSQGSFSDYSDASGVSGSSTQLLINAWK